MSWGDLSDEQVLALPTHRLLNIYRQMQVSAGYATYYSDREERINDEAEAEALREAVKAELDTRPHVERTSKPQNHSEPGRSPKRYSERYRAADGFWNWGRESKSDPVGPITTPEDAIGKQVFKVSGKPFKSKNKYNTVKSVTVNPHTNLPAFTFEEDDSIVDAHICDLRSDK